MTAPTSALMLEVGEVTVHVVGGADARVLTTFPDGAMVIARPLDEAWEQTRLHDLLHSLVAEARGELHSKALWNKAHPEEPQYHPAEVAAEEARVLRIQEALTLAMAEGAA